MITIVDSRKPTHSRFVDLTGKRFSRLLVVSFHGLDQKRDAIWMCRCDCGSEKLLKGYRLNFGHFKSCGCLRRKKTKNIPVETTKFVFTDYIGKRYGRLTILSFRSPINQRYPSCICKCDCGAEVSKSFRKLENGVGKSCGCSRIKRGRSKQSPAYVSWSHMKTRCLNPKYEFFKDYGGRGIAICDRWKNSFDNFLQDMGERPPGYSIERVDVNGNYEPSNCKWIPVRDQPKNRRPFQRRKSQ